MHLWYGNLCKCTEVSWTSQVNRTRREIQIVKFTEFVVEFFDYSALMQVYFIRRI